MPIYAVDPKTGIICRTDKDGGKSFIPPDPQNPDYQAYKASLKASVSSPKKSAVKPQPKAKPPKKVKKK